MWIEKDKTKFLWSLRNTFSEFLNNCKPPLNHWVTVLNKRIIIVVYYYLRKLSFDETL